MVFLINCTGTIRYPYGQKLKPDPYIMPHTGTDSRCITDLTVKEQIVKFLQNNIKRELHVLRLGKIVLGIQKVLT